jgi:hypothetical protein
VLIEWLQTRFQKFRTVDQFMEFTEKFWDLKISFKIFRRRTKTKNFWDGIQNPRIFQLIP